MGDCRVTVLYVTGTLNKYYYLINEICVEAPLVHNVYDFGAYLLLDDY